MSGTIFTVADVLERAADLIEPEGKWTQGEMARDRNGVMTGAECEDAECFCAWGAMLRVGGVSGAPTFFRSYVGAAISAYNDSPERKQPEVVAKLREAAQAYRDRALARGGEA